MLRKNSIVIIMINVCDDNFTLYIHIFILKKKKKTFLTVQLSVPYTFLNVKMPLSFKLLIKVVTLPSTDREILLHHIYKEH